MDDRPSDYGADRTTCPHEQAGAFDTNPFSTSRVRPGAIPFLFAPGESIERLTQRLHEHGGWAQIIGPHGSGKSTLLAAVVAELERQGRLPVLVTIAGGQRRMPLSLAADSRLKQAGAVLIVDGFEQLSWLWRWRVRRFCRRRRVGLIVTAHADVGLPTLATMQPDAELVCKLVAQLAGPWDAHTSAERLAADLARHGGNVRELFMEFYDRWEEETR